MEYVLGILLIAGFFGFSWLQGRMRTGVNRALNKSNHQKGQQLLRRPLTLTAPAMPADRVIDSVITELNVFDQVSTVKQRVWTTRVGPTRLRVEYGNKLLTAWAIDVLSTDHAEEGVSVVVTTLHATEVDGVVPGARELGLTHDRIRSAVHKLHERQHDTDGAS
jgi:hypothetical protein